MTKKDPELKENIDRGQTENKDSGGTDDMIRNDDANYNIGAEIENANASGLGAMGRNDQEQTGSSEKKSTDAGNE